MGSLRQLFKQDIKPADLRTELARRATKRTSLLRAFQQNGQLTTRELAQFGTGVSSRIFELRKAGYVIKPRYEAPGQYTYIFMGHKSEV